MPQDAHLQVACVSWPCVLGLYVPSAAWPPSTDPPCCPPRALLDAPAHSMACLARLAQPARSHASMLGRDRSDLMPHVDCGERYANLAKHVIVVLLWQSSACQTRLRYSTEVAPRGRRMRCSPMFHTFIESGSGVKMNLSPYAIRSIRSPAQ